MSNQRIMWVTVRGRLGDLTPRASEYLRAIGFDHRTLRVTVTDVAAAWSRP